MPAQEHLKCYAAIVQPGDNGETYPDLSTIEALIILIIDILF